MATEWRLETQNLTKDFGGLRAVNELTFGIAEQEIVGLIGPNGSGKSTSINLLAGYYRPSSGQILLRGKKVSGSPPWKMAKMGIARTFQHTQLFPLHSVLDNMVFARHLHEHTGILDSLARRATIGKEKRASEAKSMEILSFVGLADRALHSAGSLPPGAQRALAVAMTLASEPQVLLLDEPAAGLSAEESNRLISLTVELKKRGISVMVVDHDMRVIMRVCDRIVVIDHGTKIAEGTPKEVANNEQVIAAYLGHSKAK